MKNLSDFRQTGHETHVPPDQMGKHNARLWKQKQIEWYGKPLPLLRDGGRSRACARISPHREKLETFLKCRVGQLVTTAQMAEVCGVSTAVLSSLQRRLAKEKRLEKITRGVWKVR